MHMSHVNKGVQVSQSRSREISVVHMHGGNVLHPSVRVYVLASVTSRYQTKRR